MRLFSYTKDAEPFQVDEGIVILDVISESRLFRIYKARKGTKYIILKAAVSSDAMSLDLLRREYELSCDLNHPCIARTLGFEEQTPVGPAIRMEYVDGLSLDDFLLENPSLSQRRAILQDILDGIDYLHHRGIVHNDLKPDNIIVSNSGAARILDFGLSVSNDSVYKGCRGGTDGYTAPEVLSGSDTFGPASDIYSIGQLMILLFGGKTYRRIARQCTSLQPSERPQEIRTLRQLIKRRERRPFVVAVSVAFVVAAGILALLFVRQKVTTEHRIEEQVVSHSEAVADSLQREKIRQVEEIQHGYEADLGPLFKQTMSQIQKQAYREMAQVYTIPYYQQAIPYMDSICRLFPMLPDGNVPNETVVIGTVFNAYRQAIDSALNQLPSIEHLPSAQRDSVLLVIEQTVQQLQ